MVMVDGFTTPEGHDLPKGTIISFMSHMAQTDDETFEDPYKFDPWRFSRVREAAAKKDGSETVSGAGVTFVSTGPNHLPFGHGKHACPGRFLVDFELKMIISYLLTHYDLEFGEEYGGKRPPNRWLAEAILPPDHVKRFESGGGFGFVLCNCGSVDNGTRGVPPLRTLDSGSIRASTRI